MRSFFTLCVVLLLATAALLLGCRIEKTGEGATKKVDIETPLGSVHVNPSVNPKDLGVSVYPGATQAGEDGGKNVTVNGFGGAKVQVFRYHSDDGPAKLLDFYRKELAKFGDVTECHGSVSFVAGHMLCSDSGSQTNLVTGVGQNRHIVSVKSEGGGSSFKLLVLQGRGDKEKEGL